MSTTAIPASNVAPDGQPGPGDVPLSAHVLVVEDEHLVALDIHQLLVRLGHVPVVVHTGEEAIERALASHFDIVLMDIKLKGAMDGIEATRTINASSDVPVLYLTAYADNHTLDRARVTEPYGYVLKPFDERELKAAIEMALQRHASDLRRSEQQRVQRFLAEASARMAESLDFRAVALGAAEQVVPRQADWCQIHLREFEDHVPGFTYARPEGGVAVAPDAAPGQMIENVERRGQSELLTQLTDATSLGDALGAQHAGVLRELGARSLMCVPLIARNQVLGSLAMASGRRRPRFRVQDLATVEDLAQRLAMALDNALLYRKAERAIRMRDDVLAIVSHDLRDPLGAIILQADLLASRAETRGLAESMSRSAQRMNRLIGDLLDASAINAGKITLDAQPHSARELAREALEMFRSQALDAGVVLRDAIDDAGMHVHCDRDRVLQVLSNLIGNALKFTPSGGNVTLVVDHIGDRVRFEVRDTGTGIPPEQLSHLFERYWRARPRRAGAGLGLFIASGILSAHGSALEVQSTVGVGSRFSFFLPVAQS